MAKTKIVLQRMHMLAIAKRIIAALLLAVMFAIVNAIGSIRRPFHITQGSDPHSAIVWDGILCMLLVYGLVLLVAAFFNFFRATAVWISIALVFAGIVGFLNGYDSAWYGF
jgi:phosphatidylglycerophosphatase A